jgi:hypothetical protein
MAATFEDMIRRLWRSLDLGEPTFATSTSIVLSVDGLEVELADAADGEHVLICGQAGRLSSDPTTRAVQIQPILNSNLAHLAVNPACVCLASDDDETPLVVVRARCRYGDALRIDHLSAAIADVASVTELHARDLAGNRGPAERRGRGRRPAPIAGANDGLIIFEP